jgi:hypothetical protein
MKNDFWKVVFSFALLLFTSELFTQCEPNPNFEPFGDSKEEILARSMVNRNSEAMEDLCACFKTNFSKEELSAEELKALKLMREEEKLARDVYAKLAEYWKVQVFENITQSEQRHMDALESLLTKYDIKDPVAGFGVGKFPTMQALYNDLIKAGKTDKVSAYKVGAKIEDLDIKDLMELSKKVDNKDILAVFSNLTRGSRNHLRAFTINLESSGASYSPEFIDSELYKEITASNNERGNGVCCVGDGKGPGKNNSGPNCKGQKNGNCGQGCQKGGKGFRRGKG